MRHKFGNMLDVMHLWANPRCENDHAEAGNVSFQGDTLYSYEHYPIARNVKTDRGRVVLHVEDTYSVSTAKHCSRARQAAHGSAEYTVADVMANTPEAHHVNFKHMVENIKKSMVKFERMVYPEQWDLDQITDAVDKANEYGETFIPRTLEVHPFSIDREWLGTQRERVAERQAVKHARDRRRVAEADLAATEARHRQASLQQRLDAKLAKERFWLRLVPFVKMPQGYVRAYGDRRPSSRVENRRRSRDFAERLEAWRKDETRHLYGGDSRNDAKLKRVGDRIYTTGGAQFFVKDCARLWRIIEGCRQHGCSYQHDSSRSGIKVGEYYTLDSVSATGDVKVGCHGIKYAESRRLAIELGLCKPTMLERAWTAKLWL